MRFNRSSFGLGLGCGAAALCVGAFMMGQGSTQPPRDPAQPSTTQPSIPPTTDMGTRGEYFVTGDANHASLWLRSGSSIRWVSSADGTSRMPGDMNPDPTRPMSRPK